MISEGGLYLLLNKSNKPIAVELKNQLYTKVLPSIRKTGQYKLDANENNKIKDLTRRLKLKSKENNIHKTTKKQYTNSSGEGFIYVLKIKLLNNGTEKQCYKLGYTKDLHKRLQTYKTGNPDIELVYQDNVKCNKKQLEKCVLNLNILNRLSKKNEIICDKTLDEIKNEINDCKKIIVKHSE